MALVPGTVVTVSTLLHRKLKTVAVAALNIIKTFSLAVTQCSSCLAQLICLQLPKKFSAVCGTSRFVIILTMQVSMVTVELGVYVVLQPRRMWKERLLACVCTAGGHVWCHILGSHFCFVLCRGNLVIPVQAMNCYGNACVIVVVVVISVWQIVCTVQLSLSYNFVLQSVENQFIYDFYPQTDN